MQLGGVSVAPQPQPEAALTFDRNRAMWIAIAAALALRLVAMCVVPLIPEEAYYWVYSQNPQLSYYDHPPMVAWVIRAGTILLGNTELGVRIGATTLMVAVGLLMYRLARMWFDRPTALISALLVHVLPVYFGMGLLAPMDAALCFFWLLCLVAVSAALRSGTPGPWYLAGAALGGALLSKYSAVFLIPGVLLAVLGERKWRRHLRTVHPYLALVIAFVLFSPVLWWNAAHDWASFRFQFIQRYADDRLNFVTLPTFAGFQLLLLTPVMLAAIAYLGYRFLRRFHQRRALDRTRSPAPQRQWFAIACAAPALAAASWTSLRSGVHVNWTAPIYLGVIPAAVSLVLAYDRLVIRAHPHRRWTNALTTTACISAAGTGAVLVYLLVLEPRLNLWSAFGPWRELAAVVEEREDLIEHATGREPRIVADGKYRLASVLAFYRMPIESHPRSVVRYTTSQWIFGQEGLGYPYWSKPTEWYGTDIIYVTTSAHGLDKVRPWFDEVEIVQDTRLRGRHDYIVAIGRRMRAAPAAQASTSPEIVRSP